MNHQALLEAASAYALGALDGPELAELEAHLPTCAECRSEVDSHREVAALMAHAAPPLAPPDFDSLRSRILSEATGVRPIASVRTATGDQPGTAATQVSVSRNASWSSPWLAAAAVLLALVGVGAWWNARGENARLAQALARARSDAESTRAVLVSRDSVLNSFLGPEVHVVSLSATTDQKPSARVYWNHTKQVFIVTAFNVPPAPNGKTYQLWALRNGKAPLSMGTFNTDPSGRALAVLPVGRVSDGGFIDNCGLTLEPEGGSPQPTETPRLLGAWRHVD